MTLFALAAVAAAAGSACVPVRADRILARDLAAAVPAMSALPADQVLSYAPLPGITRVFTSAELRGFLERRGVRGEVPREVCFAWPMQPLTPEVAEKAMLESLGDGAAVKVAGLSRDSAPEGKLEFPPSGLSRTGGDPAIWRGYVEYAPGRRTPVQAEVHLSVPFVRVVASRSLRAGQTLSESDLRVESGAGVPPKSAVRTRVEDAVERVLRRPITSGTALTETDLLRANVIARGDAVHVEVLAGRARIAFEGVAQSAAGVGEYVSVRNTDTKRMVRARVVSKGAAVVNIDVP